MTKVNRTFRLDSELSKALDKICVRYGDKTYHVENALRAYPPIKKLTPNKHPQANDRPIAPKKASGFIPPTSNDVFLYLTEISVNNQIVFADGEADRFVDFYESKGWMVGKNKMKAWKAAVRNWLKNSNTQPVQQSPMKSLTDTTWADHMVNPQIEELK